jgi:hypothetical protein
VQDFQARLEGFLAAEKVASRRYRWRVKSNKEFIEAKCVIDVAGLDRSPVGRLIMTAHRFRRPRKYSFCLMYLGTPILRLDTDPARGHTNVLEPLVVRGTHWHTWPCTEAEPDARVMEHKQWFEAFIARARIRYPFPYAPPPLGLQLDLWPR